MSVSNGDVGWSGRSATYRANSTAFDLGSTARLARERDGGNGGWGFGTLGDGFRLLSVLVPLLRICHVVLEIVGKDIVLMRGPTRRRDRTEECILRRIIAISSNKDSVGDQLLTGPLNSHHS